MKRVLAFILCIMTVCTLLPASALAERLQPDALSYNEDGVSIDARSPEEMATMSLSELYQGTDVLSEGETVSTDPPAGDAPQDQEEQVYTEPPSDTDPESQEEPQPPAGNSDPETPPPASDRAETPLPVETPSPSEEPSPSPSEEPAPSPSAEPSPSPSAEPTPSPSAEPSPSPSAEPTSLELTLSAANGVDRLNVGETLLLSLTGAPEGAEILWSVSDETLAQVDANGLLTALAAGSFTVTAAVVGTEGVSAQLSLVAVDVPQGLTDGDWVYRVDENGYAVIVYYLDSAVTELAVPDSLGGCLVAGMDENALAHLSALIRIRFHGNVTAIGANALPAGVTVSAYHGAAALRYAADNGLAATDFSAFFFTDGVIDYSDIGAGRYAFAGDTTIKMRPLEASRLSVGSVFYLPASEKYENGEGFVVESIAGGDWVTLSCRVARGEEIVERVVVEEQQLEVDWDNIVLYDGVTMERSGSSSVVYQSAPAVNSTVSRLGLAHGIQSVAPAVKISDSMKIAFSKNLGQGVAFTLAGDLSVSGETSADIDLWNEKINDLSLVTTTEMKGTAEIEYSNTNWEKSTDGQEWALGRVPLVGTAVQVYIEFGVKLSFKAKAQAEFTYKIVRGMEWNSQKKKFEPVDETSKDFKLLKLKGEMTISFYFETGLHVIFIGDVVKLSFSIGFKLSISTTPPNTFCMDIKLSLVMNMSFEVMLQQKWAIKGTVYSRSIDLWDKHAEFLSDTGLDGFLTFVDECTFEDAPTHYVTFQSGTSETVPSQRVKPGSCAGAPTVTPPANATLLGWYTKDGVLWSFDTIVIKDMTLYAKWQYTDGTVAGGGSDGGDTGGGGSAGGHPLTPLSDLGYDYSEAEGGYVITGLRSKIQHLNIPETINGKPVKRIAHKAFRDCESLTSINLPNGVTSIGDLAFFNCSSLTSITLPDGITSIGVDSFSRCDSLASITLPDGVTSIGEYTFSGCDSLASIALPDGLTSIGDWAFSGCDSLASIALPDGITSIGDSAFSSCDSLASITLPDGLTSIGDWAFSSCDSLASITLPDGLTSIGDWAFYSCENLASIALPDGVTSIGDSAFSYCENLASITLPDGLTSIGDWAFFDCENLASITLPDGLTSIGDWAFSGCNSLSSLAIPRSVNTIGLYAFSIWNGGFRLYVYARSYAETYAKQNRISYTFINSRKHTVLFDANGAAGSSSLMVMYDSLVVRPADPIRAGYDFTGWYRDSACTVAFDFTADKMPDSDLTLYAGWRTADSDILYTVNPGGASVTFTGYTGRLARFTVPGEIEGLPVTAIGAYAFEYCDLARLTIPASVTKIDENAFFGLENLLSITVAGGNSFTVTGGVLFNADKTKLLRYPPIKSGTAYTIPETVTQISPYAFYAAEILREITLPDGLATVGSMAFMNCTGLTALTFPAHVATVGAGAFDGCDRDMQVFGPVGDCAIKTYCANSYIDYNRYLVKYWNGEDNYYAQYVQAGEPVPELQTPEDDILRFAGWYRDSALTTAFDLATDTMPASELNLYIKWGCDYAYKGTDALTITGYSGTDSFLTVPEAIFGIPVTGIAAGAFRSTATKPLYEIAIPSCVTTIANSAVVWDSADVKPVIVCDAGSAAAAYAAVAGFSTQKIRYAVVWQVYGGSAIGNQSVAPGTLLTQPVTLRDNHTLVGWYTDKAYTTAWDFDVDVMPAENLTLYAKWTKVDDSIPALAYTYTVSGGNVTITGYIGTTTFATIPPTINGQPVTKIADFFLQNDDRVQKLTIPASVTSIGDYAFQNSALAEITVEGTNAIAIGNGAFADCAFLTGLTLNRTMSAISPYLFSHCTGLTSLTIPAGVVTIGDGAFYGMAYVRSLTLPATVTTIGASAFAECYDLRNVTFKGTPPTGLTAANFRYCHDELTLLFSAGTTGWTEPTYTYIDVENDNAESVFRTASIGTNGAYIAGLSPNRANAVIGQTIRWTAQVSGESESWTYQYTLKKDGTQIDQSAFVAENTYSFEPEAAGSYVLSAVAKDAGGNVTSARSSTVKVTVRVIGVTNISMEPTSVTLNTGDLQQLTATITPENATDQALTWTSSNPNVATVSETGLVTAVALGTATVTAAAANGFTAECRLIVTIIQNPTISLLAAKSSIQQDEATQVTATFSNFENGNPALTWTSEDPSIATVSTSGLVRGVGVGTTTIRATARDGSGIYGEISISVTPILVSSIEITGSEYVGNGKTAGHGVVVLPAKAYDKTVTWSVVTGNDFIAVDETTGSVSGLALGKGTLRATANDGSGVYDEIEIEVIDTAVIITGANTVTGGTAIPLTAAIQPENLTGAKVEWSLSDGDEAYATLTARGETATLKAVAVTEVHTVTVHATATDGSAEEATLTVTILPPVSSMQIVQIAGEPNTETDVTGKTITLDLNDPEAAIDLRVNMLPGDAMQGASYTVSPAGIVTVTPADETNTAFTVTGTGAKIGVATVTFKSSDGSNKTAVVKINAQKLSQGLTIADDLVDTGVDGKLLAGKRTKLTAAFTGEQPSNNGIRWYMDPKYAAIATLASSGTLTAKNVTGVATVEVKAIAMDGGCESVPHTIEIVPKVTNVFIKQGDAYVTGQTVYVDLEDSDYTTMTLSMELYPFDANQIKDWTVSDTRGQFAKYQANDDGTITLTDFKGKTGTVTLTAKASDGSNSRATVRVQFVRLAQSLTITSPKTVLRGGEAITLTTNIASNRTLTDKKVNWSLSEASLPYATISGSGKLTTKAVFSPVTIEVTATASANEHATATVALDLTPAVSSVSIRDESDTSVIGQTLPLDISSGAAELTLKGLALPGDSQQELTWTTSDSRGRYSSLHDNGDGTVTLTGHAPGTVTITGTAKDGTNKRAQVRVSIGRMVHSLEIMNPLGDDNAVRLNKPLQLGVTLDGQAAAVNKVTWRLENPADSAYASVSASGKVTGKAVYGEHTVVIVAAAKDAAAIYDTYTVIVRPNTDGILTIQDESGANLTRQTVTLESGDSKTLFAYALGSSVPEDVTWKTSRAGVATVDATSGQVTVRGAGTATITATSTTDAKRTATVTIKGTVLVDSITVASKTNSNQVMAGKKLTLTAYVLPTNAGNKSVTWSLSPTDAEYATISGSGSLTARAGLTERVTVMVTATAKDGSGIEDSYAVTITPAAQGVSILLGSTVVENTVQVIDMNGHPTVSLSAKLYPTNSNQAVTWGPTSTRGAAHMDQEGTLHLVKAGTVTITAKANDGSGRSASFKLTVTARAKNLSISSKTGAFTLRGGGRLSLLPDFGETPPTNKKVRWSLDPKDAPYATIAPNGTLTARNITVARSVTVRIVSQEDPTVTAEQVIDLTPAVTSVLLFGPGDANVTKGTMLLDLSNNEITVDLSAKNLPGDSAPGWIWSSSSRSIAVVDENGTVTVQKDKYGAYRTGTVTITAKAGDGSNRSATVKLTILRSVTEIGLSTPNGITEVKAGKNIRITAVVQPQNATNKAVDWYLRPEDLVYATVRSGTVTAKKVTAQKTIVVTCTAKDGGGTSETLALTLVP